MAQHFTRMVSLRTTDEERKERMEKMVGASVPDMAGPEYPYGACLTLDDVVLAKLNIEDMPEVGDTIHLCCMCKVTSVHQSERESGKDKRIELQITDMACENEDDENESMSSDERAEKRYG